MIELTDKERKFLMSMLDQINVQGIEAKAMVLGIMVKLEKAGAPLVPDSEDEV